MAHYLSPEEVNRMLRVCGERVCTARRRRRWSQVNLAERMNVERRTVSRLEKGDPGVTMGVFLSALWVLELWSTVEQVADPAADKAGIFLERQREPERVRGNVIKEDLDF